METLQRVKEYLDTNRSPLASIKDPDEQLQLDSLALIRLVAFLERDFGIRIEDEELISDNFATLRRLGELIASRSTGAKGAESA